MISVSAYPKPRGEDTVVFFIDGDEHRFHVLRNQVREEAITSIAVIAGVMEKAGRGHALQAYQEMTDDGHRKIMKQGLGNETPGNVLFAFACRISCSTMTASCLC